MIFNSWASLWNKPEVAPVKMTRAQKRELDEMELVISVQILEPIIREAAEKTGVHILSIEPGFTRFNGTPKVPAVNFRVQASTENITKLLNMISEHERHPRVRSRGKIDESTAEAEKFRKETN